MAQNTIELKSVNDLRGMRFFIPNYQRGYRWERQQAIDLLNDIEEFSRKPNSEEIYCIQPLVVQTRDEETVLRKVREADTLDDVRSIIKGNWCVVDGQQRLTTILLILSCLGEKNAYTIQYETRENSEKFLQTLCEHPEQVKKNTDNIDYFYICNVLEAINDWLENKKDIEKKFKDILLNRVNFIWYEIDKNTDAVEVFTRLNIGKIPLTDAELIKALFLNRNNFDRDLCDIRTKQHELATEWEQIEYALQNDEFWLFIHDEKYSKPTRIDFILDLMAESDSFNITQGRKNKKNQQRIGTDEHRTFRYFYVLFEKERTNGNKRFDEFWSKVRNYYKIFSEWYHDFKLFHYIGYILTVNPGKVSELISNWERNSKEQFERELRKKIGNEISKKKEEWEEGSKTGKWEDYDFEEGEKKRDCVNLLLFHNIETVVRQDEKLVEDSTYNLPSFFRFPFHLYKREKWQVEHIRPSAGDDLSHEQVKVYLLLAKEFIPESQELQAKIDKYLKGNQNSEFLNSIIEEINGSGKGQLQNDEKNKIWNYTLLDQKTNQEYKNSIFPVKRLYIIEKERGYKLQYEIKDGEIEKSEKLQPEVAFVPPCTRKVFAKTYTATPKTMTAWTKEDAEAYLKDIKDKIEGFLDQIKEGSNQA